MTANAKSTLKTALAVIAFFLLMTLLATSIEAKPRKSKYRHKLSLTDPKAVGKARAKALKQYRREIENRKHR